MFKNISLITAVLLVLSPSCLGLEIVYPHSDNVTINSSKTFFIGNGDPEKPIVINGVVGEMDKSGGFKFPVTLDYGENTFFIDNGGNVQQYTITRPYSKPQQSANNSNAPMHYDYDVIITVTTDNTPLRSTPVDSGLNRLQHFQKGLNLVAIGEECGFYKVKLGRDDFGFISKSNAVRSDDKTSEPAQILNENITQDGNVTTLEYTLDKQVPYIISESSNGTDIFIYNVLNSPFEKYEKHIDGKVFGYSSKYDGNKLIIKIKNPPKMNPACPLSGLKITLDPGHGGSESGAVGCLGTLEKNLNLNIAANLKEKLQNKGATVYMTREDDSAVSLNDRVKYTNDNNSDIFISIHNNSLPDSMADKKASGTETYYFYPQSKALASKLSSSISKATGFNDGGARGQSFAVIRNTNCPAVLIEVGYMINPDDNAKLIDKDFQDKITDGIVQGLESYLNDL